MQLPATPDIWFMPPPEEPPDKLELPDVPELPELPKLLTLTLPLSYVFVIVPLGPLDTELGTLSKF